VNVVIVWISINVHWLILLIVVNNWTML